VATAAVGTETVTFAAKASDYRYIRRSQKMEFNQDGSSYNNQAFPEVSYQWQHGLLTLARGQDMLPDGIDQMGEPVEQDAIDYLMSRPEFGVWYQALDPIIPDAGPLFAKVTAAAARGDIDELIRLGNEEAASYHRQEVLDVITDALNVLEQPPEKAA
jgi:hypothetical protein